ncbi:Clp protease N-terminal domain-containing protein [Desertimonas flava]|uniref:Clp protease N-terminal domain-containing protein n=1 Tax=Desertimonas flava TaxID=2064846 RepID=UPI000E355CFA|nr:Clp protease N-terminal domain-containing protein [Desertimonas flava]
MFERFAREARVAVRRAAEIAEAEGAAMVQSEHLLLALVDPARDPVGRSLEEAGVTADRIRAARDREFQAALASVGIETERLAPPPPSRLRRGRATRFAPSAKLALERTLVVAIEENARRVTNRHLLIAIACAEVGTTPDLLAELGTDAEELRRIARAA